MLGKWRQWQTAVAASFGSLVTGIIYTWPSYTLSQYTAANTTLLSSPLTEMQSSLLGSLPPLGAMIGTFIVGFVINTFGRKNGSLALTIPFVLSWAMIEIFTSPIVILIARFLGGIAGGANLVYGPMYISEIAEVSIRGALASAPVTFYCFGVLFSYILGWLFSYRFIIWINLALSIFSMFLFMIIVESPVFLLKKNKEQEAQRAIAHYRGKSISSKIVLEEFSRLKQKVLPATELLAVNVSESKADLAEKEKLNIEDAPPEVPQAASSWKVLLYSSAPRRAFFIIMTGMTMQVLMGMVAVQVYAKEIFSRAAPKLSGHVCSVLFAVVLTVGCLTSAGLADRAGRRFLIITSSVCVGVCMCSLGVLVQTSIAPPWVTAMMLLFFCFSFNLGSGSIPYVLLAECFTPEVQSLASTLIIEWVWFLNFFIIGVFPFMNKFLGVHGSFYFFSCLGFANSIIAYFIVPETKGLSLDKIQERLLRQK